MRIRHALVLSLALPCLVVACSSPPPKPTTAPASSASSAPPATSGAGEIPRAEFAARIAKTICEASAPCCGATGAVHDQDFCVTQVLGQMGWTEQVAKAKTYDAKLATQCLEEARPLAVKCDAARKQVLELKSCAGVFTGTKKTGEPCEESEECASPARGTAFCWTGGMAEDPGRCAVSLPPEKGAACFTPLGKEDKKQLMMSECNDDPTLRCDRVTNTCAPRLKTGGSCEQSYECEEGALCTGHKCKPMMGASCKSSNECGSKQSCNSRKCSPGKKMGEACAELTDCAEGVCAASTKKCSTWAGTFLCKAPK